MITLYSGPLSLYSRKVEIALREKGLAFARIQVPFNQVTGYDPTHPDVRALNPRAQVPILNDGGLVLYDSTLIIDYLDEAYPQPPLYPAGAACRALCRLDELYADEIMLPALRALMHRTAPPSADRTRRMAQEADALIAEATLAGYYEELGRRLAGREFFGTDALSVADIALFMAVLFALRLGGPSLAGQPDLADWFARLSRRPSFADVAEEIAEADRRLSMRVMRA